MKRRQLISLVLSTLLLTVPVIAQGDSFVEPFRKEGKLEIKYDFVKDESTASSGSIEWRTGAPKTSEDGTDISESISLRWIYKFEGKARKSPVNVSFNFFRFSTQTIYEVNQLFIRFDDKKLTIPLNCKVENGKYISSSSFDGLVPTGVFKAMCKASKVYLKFDSQPRAYLISGDYLAVPRQIAASIPAGPQKPPAKPVKKPKV